MKYKRIVLALTALCFLCGCSAADEKDEETAETAAETSEHESLSDRWENFRGNMPNDKNMEDDLRDSDYISELKRFMSSDEGFSVKYEELSKATGINDNELIERTNGGWTARVVYFGPDIINMAVTDVSVANKYVFLQMTNGYLLHKGLLESLPYSTHEELLQHVRKLLRLHSSNKAEM